MERKNVIFLTVVAIATLLVAVVGATFAYFSTTVQQNVSNGANEASVSTAKYAESTITFSTAGNKIDMKDAIPGDEKSVDFTISNSGNTDIPYNIKWTQVTNTFNTDNGLGEEAPEEGRMSDELVYSMVCTGGTTETKTATPAPVDSNDPNATILSNITVTAGQTATCKLTVTFVETGSEQNYNQGKSFDGTVTVTTEKITASQN